MYTCISCVCAGYRDNIHNSIANMKSKDARNAAKRVRKRVRANIIADCNLKKTHLCGNKN